MSVITLLGFETYSAFISLVPTTVGAKYMYIVCPMHGPFEIKQAACINKLTIQLLKQRERID